MKNFIFTFMALMTITSVAAAQYVCEQGIYEITASGGDFTVGDDLTVVDDCSVGGDLNVTGTAAVTSTSQFTGKATFNGNIDVNDTITVYGAGGSNNCSFNHDDSSGLVFDCNTDGVYGFVFNESIISLTKANLFGIIGNLIAPIEIGGDTATYHSLGSNDAVFADDVEINGKLFINADANQATKYATLVHDGSNLVLDVFTGGLSMSDGLTITGNVSTYNIITTGGYQHLFGGSTQTTASNIFANNNSDEFFITLDANQGRQLVITDSDWYNQDHDHATPSTPTVFIHGLAPDSDNTAWLSLTHDGTNAVIGTGKGVLSVPTYTRHIDIAASQAGVGATAPVATTIGTFRSLCFDADAEVSFIDFEVPDDWIGTSDMTLKVYWCSESGDQIAAGETVKWDATYRAVDFDGASEAYDVGSTVLATTTYTQAGTGADKECIETEITLDYDDATQPLVKGEVVGIQFDRDVSTDTYSGDGCVVKWEVAFSSNTLPEH